MDMHYTLKMTNKEQVFGFHEINFRDEGIEWMNAVAEVLGEPTDTLSPETESDTHQEIAVYELANKFISISRDRFGMNTHFRAHIRDLDNPYSPVYLDKVAKIEVDGTNGSVTFSEPMGKNQIKTHGVKINSSGVVQTF